METIIHQYRYTIWYVFTCCAQLLPFLFIEFWILNFSSTCSSTRGGGDEGDFNPPPPPPPHLAKGTLFGRNKKVRKQILAHSYAVDKYVKIIYHAFGVIKKISEIWSHMDMFNLEPYIVFYVVLSIWGIQPIWGTLRPCICCCSYSLWRTKDTGECSIRFLHVIL